MKKRIVQSLLLLGMMGFLSAPLKEDSVAPAWAKEIKQTDITTQTETAIIIPNNLYAGVIKEIQPAKIESQEIATVERKEDVTITSKEYVYKNIEMILAFEEIDKKMAQLDFIEDKQEWFITYKQIIEEYSDILDPPESIYDYYTDEELNMLFRVVQAEIGDEYTFEQKCNVCSVIFNRIEHEEFPNTMLEVLTADQFSTIRNGRYKEIDVSQTTILACEYVFMIENTMPDALFFDSDGSLNYKWVGNDGAHNFYTLKGE